MLLVDTHVHIHKCFDVDRFLTSASKNFARAARDRAINQDPQFMLCLTETEQSDAFSEIANLAADDRMPREWTCERSSEGCSLILQHEQYDPLIVVAGRQIVCQERLEVLALGFAQKYPDGRPIRQTIEQVRNQGALAVLPWGFGKWIGKRGTILKDLLGSARSGELFLGDNSGRLAAWPEPAEFETARQRGLHVLPGTDPLPFPQESGRAGGYGLLAPLDVSLDRPFADLKAALLEHKELVIETYGRLETPWRFVRNQVAMQLNK